MPGRSPLPLIRAFAAARSLSAIDSDVWQRVPAFLALRKIMHMPRSSSNSKFGALPLPFQIAQLHGELSQSLRYVWLKPLLKLRSFPREVPQYLSFVRGLKRSAFLVKRAKHFLHFFAAMHFELPYGSPSAQAEKGTPSKLIQ
jgi:hypothetical protein